MEMGDGMVAVVRGLPDAALAVTLLEGNRQYTLMPVGRTPREGPPPTPRQLNGVAQKGACVQGSRAQHPSEPHLLHKIPPLQPLHQYEPAYQQQQLQVGYRPAPAEYPSKDVPVGHKCSLATQGTEAPDLKHWVHDNSAQAVDGRYTSIYKTMHCRVQPTSPPLELAEFPPQRVDPSKGHDNFEVGGAGSGETRHSPRASFSSPDRGEVDPFVRSLRKYPLLGPERSADLVEKLVSYSHQKYGSAVRASRRGAYSPPRAESLSSGQLCERHACLRGQMPHDYDQHCKHKGGSGKQSPVHRQAEVAEGAGEGRRVLYPRDYDVRHVRDVTRRVRDCVRATLEPYPSSQTACPHSFDTCDRPCSDQTDHSTIYTVNIGTQAEVPRVSREASTAPRPPVSTRHVGVPASPPEVTLRDSGRACSTVELARPRSPSGGVRRARSHGQLPGVERPERSGTARLLADLLRGTRDEAVYFVDSVVYGLEDLLDGTPGALPVDVGVQAGAEEASDRSEGEGRECRERLVREIAASMAGEGGERRAVASLLVGDILARRRYAGGGKTDGLSGAVDPSGRPDRTVNMAPRRNIVMAALEDRRRSSPGTASGCAGSERAAARPRSVSLQEGPSDGDEGKRSECASCCASSPAQDDRPAEIAPARPRAASDGAARAPRLQLPPRRSSVPTDAGRTDAGSSPSGSRRCCAAAEVPAPEASPNDRYDEFLKEWVRRIPIDPSNTDEEALVEEMRLGVYVGAWKAVTKLQLHPAAADSFYYEDLLEDEIDRLLDRLPRSRQLDAERTRLKTSLVERTVELWRRTRPEEPLSYRRRLIESVVRAVPRPLGDDDADDDRVARLVEEVQRHGLADEFVLYVVWRDGDRVRADVHRSRLERGVRRLIDDLRADGGEDRAPRRDDVMRALHRVPAPGARALALEAELVLLGREIERWYADLPLAPSADAADALSRRARIGFLARKIHEFDARLPPAECEARVRREIREFLARVPLTVRDERSEDFVVDELVNRLRSRPLGGARISDPAPTYREFDEAQPPCSTFIEAATGPTDNESYTIFGGERTGSGYAARNRSRSATSDSRRQWYTLEDSRVHPAPRGERVSVSVQAPGSPSTRGRDRAARAACRRESGAAEREPDAAPSVGCGPAATEGWTRACRTRSARAQTGPRDSDSGEEVRCRCSERVWRRRRRRAPPPCDPFAGDFPACFPVPYPCPYYF